MRQLTYISTAARDLPATAVPDILNASRRNNAAAGVSGLLLYDGRRFLQALEGEAETVNITYERIKADPRHRAIVLLAAGDVSARAFGDWSMAAQAVARAEGQTIVEAVDQMTEAVTDVTMRELFRSFARMRRPA